jgi:hypothetical protein
MVTTGLRPLPGRDLSRGDAACRARVRSPPPEVRHADPLDRWNAASDIQLRPCPQPVTECAAGGPGLASAMSLQTVACPLLTVAVRLPASPSVHRFVYFPG